jgi:hypothetical protein
MARQALELEFEGRPKEELMFFSVHGYWPEAASLVQREECSFTTHGLKTTIILEPEVLNAEGAPDENN